MSDGGKGSSPRPIEVSQEEFDLSWEAIFGKRGASAGPSPEELEESKIKECLNSSLPVYY